MNLLREYPWPGNVRELQNIVERSVILCETENFTVDESWLSSKSDESELAARPFFKMPAAEEKRTIEAALSAAGGRVAGPAGAAALFARPEQSPVGSRPHRLGREFDSRTLDAEPRSRQRVRHSVFLLQL